MIPILDWKWLSISNCSEGTNSFLSFRQTEVDLIHFPVY